MKARPLNPEGKSVMNQDPIVWIAWDSQLEHLWFRSLVQIPRFRVSLVWTLGSNPDLTCLVLSSKIDSILFTTMCSTGSTYSTSVSDRGYCIALWLVIRIVHSFMVSDRGPATGWLNIEF